jgi:hypothetical protein
MFFKRCQSLLNLLLKYMKVSCLAMTQTQAHIVFSIRTLVVLKLHVMRCLDFDETFAPVARLESICILFAYATHHDFKLY